MPATITYLTGPVRSGKSRRAIELAAAWPLSVEQKADIVFVATYRLPQKADHHAPPDEEMWLRVQRHRAERPSWRTLEAPRSIAETLASMRPLPTGVVIDCLTLWISDRLELDDATITTSWENELAALRRLGVPVIVVGNEVGWSLVPESLLLRRFRDLTGVLSQITAAAADEAWLLVAGCAVLLKKK